VEIISENYFDDERGCGYEYSILEENVRYFMDCDYVVVTNYFWDNILCVDNEHSDIYPKKEINCYGDCGVRVGFWRKNKK